MLTKPLLEEYPAYYETYVKLVQEGNLAEILVEQLQTTTELVQSLTEETGDYRYAPGKWSIKEVLGHVADTERIMAYRMLCIARGDRTPLPGYDENEYVAGASFAESSLSDILKDYSAVRCSTLTLLRGITEEAWLRTGTANNGLISARALAAIIAGHERHHIRIIQERYLRAE